MTSLGRKEQANKPDSVLNDHLSGADVAVYLFATYSDVVPACNAMRSIAGRTGEQPLSYLVLLRVGFST